MKINKIKMNRQKISLYNKVKVKCETCNETNEILKISFLRNLEANKGFYSCLKCSSKRGAKNRPQNSKDFWTEEKRKELGIILKNSDNYRTAIKNREMSGENNGMFGKNHSPESIQKMKKSRTGKKQSSQTKIRKTCLFKNCAIR